MSISINIPDEYGYVILDLALAYIVFFGLGEMVVWARKKYDVPYPTMYSEKSKIFNCYQRAHQNGLESLAFYIVFLLLGGLQHPLVSAVAGCVWCVGRLIYAFGYYTGDAKKRAPGSILAALALFTLLGCTVSLALHMLNYLGPSQTVTDQETN